MEFTYDGGGLGKGGLAELYLDGTKVGDGRIGVTVPMLYSGDETCDVGYDSDTAVSEDHTSATSHFTGTVKWGVFVIHELGAVGQSRKRGDVSSDVRDVAALWLDVHVNEINVGRIRYLRAHWSTVLP